MAPGSWWMEAIFKVGLKQRMTHMFLDRYAFNVALQL
jgi:hypothetical protein